MVVLLGHMNDQSYMTLIIKSDLLFYYYGNKTYQPYIFQHIYITCIDLWKGYTTHTKRKGFLNHYCDLAYIAFVEIFSAIFFYCNNSQNIFHVIRTQCEILNQCYWGTRSFLIYLQQIVDLVMIFY